MLTIDASIIAVVVLAVCDRSAVKMQAMFRIHAIDVQAMFYGNVSTAR